jgi:hypothetical protein
MRSRKAAAALSSILSSKIFWSPQCDVQRNSAVEGKGLDLLVTLQIVRHFYNSTPVGAACNSMYVALKKCSGLCDGFAYVFRSLISVNAVCVKIIAKAILSHVCMVFSHMVLSLQAVQRLTSGDSHSQFAQITSYSFNIYRIIPTIALYCIIASQTTFVDLRSCIQYN